MKRHELTFELIQSLLSLKRLLQFLSIGIMGAVVDNLVLIGIVEAGILSPTPGAVISKESSIMVMFILNERFTFSQHGVESKLGTLVRFLKSNFVRSGGAAVGIGVLFVLHTFFGMWYVIANIIGIGVGFIVNYTFESLFTWRVQEQIS